MKSWKTTVAGIVTAVMGFILFSPSYFPPWAVDIAKYITVGGLASMGLLAKDSTMHSTVEEVQASTEKEVIAEVDKEAAVTSNLDKKIGG